MSLKERVQQLARKAGERAVAYKNMGYHCSESVFLAVNEVLRITDPALVRAVTGFHGGGGTRRKAPDVDLNRVLADVASGRDQRPREELPVEQVGHLCGALASGMVCIGLLFGRRSPQDDLTCVDELCFELHRRFEAEFGARECAVLREQFVPHTPTRTCEPIYRRAAEMAVELILQADAVVPECGSRAQAVRERVLEGKPALGAQEV